MIEMLAGGVLLLSSILPFQNYEQMIQLGAGFAVLWALFYWITRQRSLLSTAVFFHFCVLLLYATQGTASLGQISEGLYWRSFLRWAVVLFFIARDPKNTLAPTIFLIITFISPLNFFVLRGWDDHMPGVRIWMVLVLRAVWICASNTERKVSIPWYLVAFLGLCAASIPFSFYAWRSLQFLYINIACVLTYYVIRNSYDRIKTAILVSYLYLALVLSSFAIYNKALMLQLAGIRTLGMRLSIVMIPNDIVPQFLLITGFLLHFLVRARNVALQWTLGLALLVTGVLMFFTYSRNGWLDYIVLLAIFAVSRWEIGSARTVLKFAAGAALAALLLFALLPPVRATMRTRIKDVSSASYRLVNWEAGLRTVGKYPFFGVGWLNTYVHCRVPASPTGMDHLYEGEALLPIQTHSFFLDLAEACGIPFALVFVTIVVIHINQARRFYALIGALVALSFNGLLDSACLWLSNYPHLWFLLAVLFAISNDSEQVAVSKPASIRIPTWVLQAGVAVVFLLAVVVPGAVGNMLQQGLAYHRLGNEQKAMQLLHSAHALDPLRALPLEQIKDIYLAQKDPAHAEQTLNELMGLKKDYAPYFAQLGTLRLAEGHDSASMQALKTAVDLDPYAALKESPYLSLALLARKQNDMNQFRKYLSLAFLYPQTQGSYFSAVTLVNSLDEQTFFNTVFDYAFNHYQRIEDLETAVDNFHTNLTRLGSDKLAVRVLENLLQKRKGMSQDSVDYFANLLGQHYQFMAENDVKKIKSLMLITSPETAHLLNARYDLAYKKLTSAYENLQRSFDYYNYRDMQDVWEQFYVESKKRWELRVHYRIMEQLNLIDQDSSQQMKIADSYLQDERYAEAARAFHRLSLYEYTDPLPHWREARCWWLAGEFQRAKLANLELQQLISSNRLTQNLYRAGIDLVSWDGVGVVRAPIPNKFDGLSWKTGIFAHAPTTIFFPDDVRIQRIEGEIALVSGANFFQKADGVRFVILDENQEAVSFMELDPRKTGDKPQPFVCEMSKPQNITLKTLTGPTPYYDWALWVIKKAQ